MADEHPSVILARAVREVYEAAEDALLRVVAEQVTRGARDADAAGVDPSIGIPALAQARALSRIREVANRVVQRLDVLGIATLWDVLTRAQALGVERGQREIDALLSRARNDYASPVPTAPLGALARNQVDLTRSVHLSILRQVDDAYRDAVARVVPSKASGANAKRLDMAKTALADLSDRGIVGFTDKAGRRWELESYIEMATRTASARVMVEGQLDRLASIGETLVYVSDSPQNCGLCAPFEHRVLRNGAGATGKVTLPHAVTDEPVTVDVLCTVQEAMLRGLFHPNCTHSVSLWLPGVTKLNPGPDIDQSETKYVERQQLRALERGVRKWKKRAAVGDPNAPEKVRAHQARIREHVKTTGLLRQPNREKIGVAR